LWPPFSKGSLIPGKEDKERQLPIDRASNPLPGSPVCLAHDDVVTSLFNRRACGSDNLRPEPAAFSDIGLMIV
jgi:hypothetical protein